MITCLWTCACLAQDLGPNVNSPYGINFHAPGGADLPVLADEVKNCGIGWIRVDFNWFDIETSQNNFNWALYDTIVAVANSRNLIVFATIAYSPQWATLGAVRVGVPKDPADWYDICYQCARRYDGNHGHGIVKYWGMWNEANLDGFFEGTQQQYIDIILKNGADGIHAGNPNAKVCGPEMAHLTSGDKDWYDWLRKSIEQAGSKLDICTHHMYDGDGFRDITDKLEHPTAFGGNPRMWGIANPSVKEVLQYAGWYGKPFWFTETGWESRDVGETNQANYYAGLLNDWCTGRPGRGWLHRIFFYELMDTPSFPSLSWGIVALGPAHTISHRKPAYAAYKKFIKAHSPTPVGRHAKKRILVR